MPDVTLRGVTLAAPCRAGAGRCRVIVPVTALLPQPAALQAQAAAAAGDIVELRLDALADQSHLGLVWAVQTVRRAAGQTPLLVTLRTAREGGLQRLDQADGAEEVHPDDELGVDLHAGAQAVALGARAERIVEGEAARLNLLHTDAAVRA